MYKQEENTKTNDDKQHENQKSDIGKERESQENSESETQEGSSTDTDCDQDSDVSFAEDSDKEIDTAELEQEDWIEYMKRNTAAAEEEMKKAKIPCWIEMHRRMEFRLAMRVASLPKRTMGKENSRMETRPHHQNQDMQSSRKTKKEMGRRNQRLPQARGNRSNERQRHKKTTTPWLWTAKQRDKWKEKEDEIAAARKNNNMESS